ncbi:MAG: hypothetical protein M3Q93_00525 [Gemmatimonadota bacterium]|nr:hypothetical protein [Gemmatimonadota bacterium]
MLPPGLSAQPADSADHHDLHALHPSGRTTVRLVVGACSCDLVRDRHPDPRQDERRHRDRFRRAGAPRAALIDALERHRRGAEVRPPAGGWPRALAAFVAEHARNAGDTLYVVRFTTHATLQHTDHRPDQQVRRVSAADVVAFPARWLEERVRVIVSR